MNGMRFSAEAQALGQKLLDHHHDVCSAVSNPASALTDSQVAQNTIRYGTLCERAGIWELRRISGGFLHEIAVWCEQQGWPPINALVVNESGYRVKVMTARRVVAMPTGRIKSGTQSSSSSTRSRCRNERGALAGAKSL